METLGQTRIDKLIKVATEKVGTEYKLAQYIGYDQAAITKWKNKSKPCPLEAQALMAEVAGFNASEVIAVAILERNADKPRFEKLEIALGKAFAGMKGAALVSIVASVGLAFSSWSVVLSTQCVLLLSKKTKEPTSRRLFFFDCTI